jgi:integrase/recombinase XerD
MANLDIYDELLNDFQMRAMLDESIIDILPKTNTKQGLSYNTKQAYKSAIRDFNNFLIEKHLNVNQESLKLYFDYIKGRLSPSTLNLRKSALLKCIKALIGENNILKNMAIERVFQDIDSYKMDKSVSHEGCLTENEIRKMMEVAQSTKTRLIIHFLYKTACRVSEMINLRLSDCRLINGHIRIRIIGKGKKERFVYIPQNLYEAIRHQYQGQTWLFESKSGRQLHRRNIAHQTEKTAKRVGVTSFHPHMLRHSRATDMLLNKDISLKAVSKFLGHASVATTAQMYIHDEVDYQYLFSRDSI